MADTGAVQTLLADGPKVVNIGLVGFAEDLRGREVPVVHVDWSPPAGGDQAMIDLLEKMGR